MVRISCVLLSLRPQVYKYARVGRAHAFILCEMIVQNLMKAKKVWASGP